MCEITPAASNILIYLGNQRHQIHGATNTPPQCGSFDSSDCKFAIFQYSPLMVNSSE